MMQLHEDVIGTEQPQMLTVEQLYQKSEKLRKTMWGQHAGVCNKLAGAEEKIDWLIDRLARLERTINEGL